MNIYLPQYFMLFASSSNINQQTVSVPLSTSSAGIFQSVVTCTLLKIPSTFETNGVFSETSLSNSNRNGSITFNCSQVGRAVPFICHDKFNKSILFLDKSFIQCRKAPVVSVRPENVRLIVRPIPFTQQLSVVLSENASNSRVVVTCQKKEVSGLSVSIPPVTIAPGMSTGVISVTIISFSNSSSFTIACKAQSDNGNQYITETSEGISSKISLIGGEMMLMPNDVNLYSLQFQVLLNLNAISRYVAVLCSVSVANNETDANNLLNDNTCEVTSRNDGNANSWTITPYLNEFKAASTSSSTDSLSRLLTVKRNSYPSSNYTNEMEVLILKCCSTTQNATVDPAFANIKTTSRINILLKPALFINKGDELPSDQSFTYPDPAWTEISPCPCDLTAGTCDLGCFCDNLCPVNQSANLFSGLFGGNFHIPNQHSCDAALKATNNRRNILDLINRGFTRLPEYHPILCIVTDNNAVLGKYYKSSPPAKSYTDLDNNVQNAKIEFPSDQVIDSSAREVSVGEKKQKGRLYVYGDPLHLMIESVILASSDDPSIFVSEYNDYFVLPDNMNCDLESNIPVEFLSDRSIYRCPISLSSSRCQDAVSSKESIGNGWGPRKLLDRFNITIFAPVFRLRMNRLRDNVPVPVEVNYFCLSQDEVQNFIISSQSTLNVKQSNQNGFFNHNCTYNDTTKLTLCIPLQSSINTNTFTPTVCNWHNGFNFPPEVEFSNNVCNNVVLKVDYKFVWSNGSISQALGQVYLANLSVTSTEIVYYQEYSVNFVHTTELDGEVNTNLPSHFLKVISGWWFCVSTIESFSDQPFPRLLSSSTGQGCLHRSTWTGYELDDIVVTGQVTSLPTQRFLVQTNAETNSISGTVKTGPDMLCDNAEVDQLKFGKNTVSSCRVLLNLNDFENCDKLRSLTTARLNLFIPSEVIAVYPQASKTSSKDWIFIHKSDPLLRSSEAVQNSSAIGAPAGFCPNITSAIYLKIIYAIQGKLQGIPIKQIVSASVEYSQDDWQFMCDSVVYPSVCRNSSVVNDVKNFYLSTIIMFSEISVPTEEVLNAKLNCDLDTCWNDAFYAWTGLNKLYIQTGKIEQTFEIGVTLARNVLLFVYLKLTFVDELIGSVAGY
ncbi:unnamed protein product [Heterobilharzia americana]|nr:unnamed protein product [Heterobilharzia americana]